MKNYIAYGSNLNLSQMQRRCPNARLIARGCLENYILTFRGHNSRRGVANVETAPGRSVRVAVFSISETDEKNLDKYEGFPSVYDKVTISVKIEAELPETTLEGIMYVMPTTFKIAEPQEAYVEIIRQGYRDCGWDPDEVTAWVNENHKNILSQEYNAQT